MSILDPSPLLNRLADLWISPKEIRAETWALRMRHQGRIAEGALMELSRAAPASRRAGLLKAVLRSQRQ